MALHHLQMLLGWMMLLSSSQAFYMFPSVDPASLAGSLNISVGCIDALNETLSCDQDLFRMVVDFDDYFWEQDNVTDLCQQECQADAYQWLLDVEDACDGENMNVYGKLVSVDDIAGRYWDGLGLACLTSNTSDSCLIQSLNWVGSDYIRPDCDANPSDPACTDPDAINPDNIRMANLYDENTLCSDCFVQLMFARLSSPYLPDTNHSDYLVGQYQDIVNVCSTSMPDLIIRATSSYDLGPPPPTPTPTGSTCAGRTVQISGNTAGCDSLSAQYNVTTGDLQYATNSVDCSGSGTLCLPDACTLAQVPSSGNYSCDSLSQEYSTGSLNISTIQFLTWNPNILGLCNDVTSSQYICVTPPGGIYISPPAPVGSTNSSSQDRFGSGLTDGQGPAVPGVTTTPAVSTTSAAPTNAPSPVQSGIASNCVEYSIAVSGDYCQIFAQNNHISTSQLYTWNPILGANGEQCNILFQANVYYCISAPGGPTTTTSAGAPGPTQSGISPYCSKYQLAVSGDSCDKFSSEHSITDPELYAWNSVLGNNGANCGTALEANVYYCVGITPPSPTQSGIASDCYQFRMAVSGGSCSAFTADNGVTSAQLYAWNPVLGSNGENCGTAFQANVYYCIGVVGGSSGSATTTQSAPTSTGSPVPSPTQSGIISSCNKFAKAVSGDYCTRFAQENNISTNDLYTWNTVLGANGANCGTAMQANVYYCIGIAPPSPVQSGIASNCDKFAIPSGGDYCDHFSSENGITDAQLYAWNPVLGNNGQNCGTAFQANVNYCVGVSSYS